MHGFVNVAHGLRAIGYAERDQLPQGPVALVTHSGSVFSALLRAQRAFGFTVAVSSGQELVTSAAAYARYALTLPRTRVLALVLETIRDAAAAATTKPVAVLASVPAAIDQAAAARLREAGVPVLESTRTGLLALSHLLAPRVTPPPPPPAPDITRRDRWTARIGDGLTGAQALALLRDYGIPAVRARVATTLDEALAAAAEIGYPVAVKTDEAGIAHKTDVGGVRLGIPSPAELTRASPRGWAPAPPSARWWRQARN